MLGKVVTELLLIKIFLLLADVICNGIKKNIFYKYAVSLFMLPLYFVIYSVRL